MVSANGSMDIELTPRTRRYLDRLTTAITRLAIAQEYANRQNGSVTFTNTIDVYRDAVSGSYVTKDYAEANPDTTVKESVPLERFEQDRNNGEENNDD